jgi:Dimerisation domain
MRRDLRSTPSVEPSIKKIDMETTTTQSETSAGADNANSTASPEPSTHAADFAATDKDFERMMQMLTGYFVTQIAGAVATYSIADHLAKGPATAEQIAAIEGIDSAATFRLLRACASLGLVTCDDSLTFSATPLLGTLRTNVPGSLHSMAIAGSAPGHGCPGVDSWTRCAPASGRPFRRSARPSGIIMRNSPKKPQPSPMRCTALPPG